MASSRPPKASTVHAQVVALAFRVDSCPDGISLDQGVVGRSTPGTDSPTSNVVAILCISYAAVAHFQLKEVVCTILGMVPDAGASAAARSRFKPETVIVPSVEKHILRDANALGGGPWSFAWNGRHKVKFGNWVVEDGNGQRAIRVPP